MKPVPKCKEEAIERPVPKRPPTLDEMLDEALDETFPASDPVALTAPAKTIRTRAGVGKLVARKGNLRRSARRSAAARSRKV